MASHQQPSPTAGIPPHHAGPHPAHAQANGHPLHVNQPKTPSQYLGQLTEAVWTQMGMCAARIAYQSSLTSCRFSIRTDARL